VEIYLQGPWPLQAVVALVAGLVILLAPRFLNYAIAAYLLLVGALGLLEFLAGHGIRPLALAALVAGVLILARPAILGTVVGVYLILVGLFEAGVLRL